MNYWPAPGRQPGRAAGPARRADRLAGRARRQNRARPTTTRAAGWRTSSPTRGASPRPANTRSWGATTGGSSWLCEHLWSALRLTPATRPTWREVYPILKGSALFYLDNLMEEPKHGWLVTGAVQLAGKRASSCPTDGAPTSAWARPSTCSSCANSSATPRRAAEILGLDADLRKELLTKRAQARAQPDRPGRTPAGMAGALRRDRAAPPPRFAPLRAASLPRNHPRGHARAGRRRAQVARSAAATPAPAGRWPGR